MKIWFCLGALLQMGIVVHGQGPNIGTIKVRIEGVLPGRGQVRIALEKNAEDFDAGSIDSPKYLSRIVKAEGETVIASFPDIPYGTYAIKTFQDLDGDGKLKRDSWVHRMSLGVSPTTPAASWGRQSSAMRSLS